ncbi:MAG TPA: PH domain-containing protein [Pseudonocardia sp.]|jgi:hypothetical protein|nr:PH domain-containing protein [Pseudonocardia sp.]
MPEQPLVAHPHRARWAAWIAALVLIGVMLAVAVGLRDVSTGVQFRLDDQVAMVLLGVLMGVAMLVPAYAVVRADADGVEVRNLLITRRVEWSDVLEVGFPAGARWARLELPYDEYLPVSAIQLVDGQRAVAAMVRLRALHEAYLARSSSRTDG